MKERTVTDFYTARNKKLALMLLSLTQFVVVIDASIINVALPTIGRHLHFSQTALSWVVNSYTLTFGGFLLLGGRLADVLGRRRMFISGLIVFALASLVGGFAQSEGWLLAARTVQGLGAAIVSPAALSIITTVFAEGGERNKALGVWGAVAGAGGAAGVLLGGILTQAISWRWVLFVNVPIAVFAAVMAPRCILESEAEDAHSLDLPGALTATAGLALLIYAVVDAVNKGWGSAATISKLAIAGGLLAAFVVLEAREREPLLPLRLFRLRTLSTANAVGLLTGMSLYSMFFFISLYMQQVLHYSPLKTGLSYLPLAVAIIVSAGIAAQLVTRLGFKPALIAGQLMVGGALVWFSRVPAAGGMFTADILGPSLLAGVGLGFSFTPVTIAAMTGTTSEDAGVASGLINTSTNVGGALGIAILATIATTHTKTLLQAGHVLPFALTKGFDRAFLVGAGFSACGALLAAVGISWKDSRAQAAAARAGDAAVAAAGFNPCTGAGTVRAADAVAPRAPGEVPAAVSG
jgi:EmrB/QacA subfamily drug resistance transporter